VYRCFVKVATAMNELRSHNIHKCFDESEKYVK
jgi:hypothetical protein